MTQLAKQRPILFSGSMVQAILGGRKTQTRRVLKLQPSIERVSPQVMGVKGEDYDRVFWGKLTSAFFSGNLARFPEWMKNKCPYGQIGDVLWVRETWRPALSETHECIAYRADMRYDCGKEMPQPDCNTNGWKPSIFMPRTAARIFLEITDVRLERLQDISESDAIAEGITDCGLGSEQWQLYGKKGDYNGITRDPVISYSSLWDSINGDRHPWQLNPFVWVVEFKQITLAQS